MIKPQNSAEVVQEFILLLQLDGDAVFTLRQNDQGVVEMLYHSSSVVRMYYTYAIPCYAVMLSFYLFALCIYMTYFWG